MITILPLSIFISVFGVWTPKTTIIGIQSGSGTGPTPEPKPDPIPPQIDVEFGNWTPTNNEKVASIAVKTTITTPIQSEINVNKAEVIISVDGLEISNQQYTVVNNQVLVNSVIFAESAKKTINITARSITSVGKPSEQATRNFQIPEFTVSAPTAPVVNILQVDKETWQKKIKLSYNWQGNDGGSTITSHCMSLYKDGVFIKKYQIDASSLPFEIVVEHNGLGLYTLKGEVLNGFGFSSVAEKAITVVDTTFKVQDLFKNGEQGAFYDVSDINTIFQDHGGSMPQPIWNQTAGLILDKRFGLEIGTENLVNNSELNDLTGWVVYGKPVNALSNGEVSILGSGTAGAGLYQIIQTNGDYIKFTCKVKVNKDADWVLGGQNIITYSVGALAYQSQVVAREQSSDEFIDFACYMRSTSADKKVAIYLQNLTTTGRLVIKNPRAHYVKGNHATEPVFLSRPVYRTNPLKLMFDNEDDKLTTYFPTQLESCTVVRAVAKVGTQILTSQSIPANHIENKDFSGLLIVNRALTQLETEEVTRIFNKLAGL